MQHRINADKGFQYSPVQDSYISHKKNHFQITTQSLVDRLPKYVYAEDKFHEISHFCVDMYAVKCENKTEIVSINQSNLKERKHKKYIPIEIKTLVPHQDNLVTIKRLHFGDVTKNNKWINNFPNQNQRYFHLIVELKVVTVDHKTFVIYSVESENKIIVRVIIIIFFKLICTFLFFLFF